MRKFLYYMLILFSILFYGNVFACGEITDVTSSVGTISKKDNTHYVISIPSGTSKITLNANTLYDWVEGYAPREVSTNNRVELRVDGNKCGYGIYTYFFEFETIKENTNKNPDTNINDNDNNNNNIDNSQNENSSNTENNENIENNENNQNTENQENSADTNETTNTLYLKELTIEGLDFSFEKNIFDYTLEVQESFSKTVINAVPESEGIKVEIIGDNENLAIGTNEFSINLSDDTGKVQTYKVTIDRKKALSTNNFLANIKIQNYTLNFDPSINTYNIIIGNEKYLNITPTPESEKATTEVIGNNNLKDGSVITIRVKSEDGNTKDYIIKVTKKIDYTMYFIYGGAGLLLILIIIFIIIITKKNKKKRLNDNLNVVSVNNPTAGEVRVDSENSVIMEQTVYQNVTNEVSNSGLKFIEPSYLDNQNNNPKVDENESKTEVFKL